MNGDAAPGFLASASGGTPKLGYHCHTCEDWGTIVADDAPAEGVTHLRVIPCPDHTPPPAATEQQGDAR